MGDSTAERVKVQCRASIAAQCRPNSVTWGEEDLAGVDALARHRHRRLVLGLKHNIHDLEFLPPIHVFGRHPAVLRIRVAAKCGHGSQHLVRSTHCGIQSALRDVATRSQQNGTGDKTAAIKRRHGKRSENSTPHSREKATRAARGRDHRLVANGHLQSACHASRRGAQLRKTKEIRNICGRTPCGTQLHLGIAAGKARGSWQERAGRSERRRAQRRCGEGCEEAAHSVRRESQPLTALKAVGSCNSCNEPRPFPVTSR